MHLGIKSDACNYMETQFFLKDFYTLLCVNHRNLQIGTPSDSRVHAVPRCCRAQALCSISRTAHVGYRIPVFEHTALNYLMHFLFSQRLQNREVFLQPSICAVLQTKARAGTGDLKSHPQSPKIRIASRDATALLQNLDLLHSSIPK